LHKHSQKLDNFGADLAEATLSFSRHVRAVANRHAEDVHGKETSSTSGNFYTDENVHFR